MKVTVISLVYNHEKYIRSALDGFVNQKTNFDYEVLVHDDASTDNSASIIREYAEKHPHIIKPILQSENQFSKGVDIYNTFLIPRVTGDYIAACEGDDCWIDAYKLQKQVDFLDAHPDYIACVHNSVMEDTLTGKRTLMYSHEKDEDIDFLSVAKGGCSCYQTASLMCRKVFFAQDLPEFLRKNREFGDYQLSMALTLAGRVRFLNEAMSVYRFRTESSSSKACTVDMRKNAQILRAVCEVLEEVDEYTEYRYHEKLQEYKLHWEYEVLYFEENYTKLRTGKYRNMYLSYPVGYRVKTYLKQYFRKPYALYRQIKYGR